MFYRILQVAIAIALIAIFVVGFIIHNENAAQSTTEVKDVQSGAPAPKFNF